MKAMIFEGNTNIGMDDVIDIPEWNLESITQAFIDFAGDNWIDEDLDGMFVDGPVTIRDTIDIVNNTIAQVVACPVDGGNYYLVLLH